MGIINRKRKPVNKTLNQLPGEVIYVGDKVDLSTTFEVTTYDKTSHSSYKTTEVEAIFKQWVDDKITWININGLNDVKAIQTLGKNFSLHPLLLEDVVNTQQRPKLDEYDDYILVVLKL